MVEVGIPVYHARDTIENALNSLLVQTRKEFKVCLSIDGDEDDYHDIISKYRRLGLKIRVLHSKKNEGPGIARQNIIDSTDCEYITFLDADDLLMPGAIRNLYNSIRQGNFDIVKSGFIREENLAKDTVFPSNMSIVTWMHGKIYRVGYLKENNIRFLKGLYCDEDSYFNLVAWYCTKRIGELNEITYYWRDNQNSATRKGGHDAYFRRTYNTYVYGQLEAMRAIYERTHELSHILMIKTLLNVYNYWAECMYRNLDSSRIEQMVKDFKQIDACNGFLDDKEVWKVVVQDGRIGTVYDGGTIVFFKEPFNKWLRRLLG